MGHLFQRSLNESVTGQLFGVHGASPSSTRLVKDRTGSVSDPPKHMGEAKGGGGTTHQAEGCFLILCGWDFWLMQ